MNEAEWKKTWSEQHAQAFGAAKATPGEDQNKAGMSIDPEWCEGRIIPGKHDPSEELS